MQRGREAIKQRKPLTVAMVKTLEEILARFGRKGPVGSIIAGAALFAVYSRARVGDLRRCGEEPHLDLGAGVGYVETRFVDHKTAKPGTKRAMPIAGTVHGVSQT